MSMSSPICLQQKQEGISIDCRRYPIPKAFKLNRAPEFSSARYLDSCNMNGRFGESDYEDEPQLLGLFHRLNRHDAYVYADYNVTGRRLELCIQHRESGKRLDRAVCDRYMPDKHEPKCVLRLYESEISQDERHIALLYSTGIGKYVTCLWRINPTIDFTSSERNQNWARETFYWETSDTSQKSRTRYPYFNWTRPVRRLMFNDLDDLLCPAGRINLRDYQCDPAFYSCLSLQIGGLPDIDRDVAPGEESFSDRSEDSFTTNLFTTSISLCQGGLVLLCRSTVRGKHKTTITRHMLSNTLPNHEPIKVTSSRGTTVSCRDREPLRLLILLKTLSPFTQSLLGILSPTEVLTLTRSVGYELTPGQKKMFLKFPAIKTPHDEDQNLEILSVSPSGRYLICVFRAFWRGTIACKEAVLYLYDADMNSSSELSEWYSVPNHFEAVFFNNERRMIFASSSINPPNLKLSLWDLFPVKLGSAGHLLARKEYTENLCRLSVDNLRDTILIVTSGRIITELHSQTLKQKTSLPEKYNRSNSSNIVTQVSSDGRQLASIVRSPSRSDVRIWQLEGPTKFRDVRIGCAIFDPSDPSIRFSSNLESLFMHSQYGQAFWLLCPSHFEEQDRCFCWHSDSEKYCGREQYKIANHSGSDLRRQYYFPRGPLFSSCGNHLIWATDSFEEEFRWKPPSLKISSASFSGHSRSWGIFADIPLSTNCTRVEKSLHAQVTATVHPWKVICLVSVWGRPTNLTSELLCDVQGIWVDLATKENTPLGELLTINEIAPPADKAERQKDTNAEVDHPNDERSALAWKAAMGGLSRSVVISKCGSYAVVAASTGIKHWQRVLPLDQHVDQPDVLEAAWVYCDENTNLKRIYRNKHRGNGNANPRVVGPEWVYWYEHRFRTELVNQAVLLYRDSKEADYFSKGNQSVSLTSLPAYLEESKAFLLVPVENSKPMKIVVIQDEIAPEIVELRIAWNDLIAGFDDAAGSDQ